MGGLLAQTWMKLSPIPLPPAASFAGCSVLVTGGTSGLGLAAAAHFVNLGAAEVIITSRDPGRAESALAELAALTSGRSRDVVLVMGLDLDSYDSVAAFAEEVAKVRKGRGGLDCVVLNAGMLAVDFVKSSEGWEQTLQVNVLSTTLLALLLLPVMKAERAHRSSPAHLCIVGSNLHLDNDLKQLASWIPPPSNSNSSKSAGKEGGAGDEEGILRQLNRPENYKNGNARYNVSKLLAHYAAAELATLALDAGDKSRPQVIVNTCCPGIVATSLGRHISDQGPFWAAAIAVFHFLFGKTPENGGRTLIAAVRTTKADNGKFVYFYGTQAEYEKQAQSFFHRDPGAKVRARAWNEIVAELESKVPAVKDTLSRL